MPEQAESVLRLATLSVTAVRSDVNDQRSQRPEGPESEVFTTGGGIDSSGRVDLQTPFDIIIASKTALGRRPVCQTAQTMTRLLAYFCSRLSRCHREHLTVWGGADCSSS